MREAEVIKGAHKKDTVEIGDTVVLDSGLMFQLVDSQQANPPEKISIESPMGKSIFNKKIGESFTVLMPSSKEENYKIVKIIED